MDYTEAYFTYIEELVESEIDRADTKVLEQCKNLFNIKGTELDAVRVGKKQIPKIKVELSLEIFDNEDESWEEIAKIKPMWLKTEKDVEKKLKPALEELSLLAAESDFLTLHCQ